MIQTRLKRLEIAQQRTTLPNGLQVVVHEDRSSPIVAVHIMYRVGSKNERPGRTGLAHLLEHLLFEGSENCPKGQFDRLLEQVGGSNNGSTWFDRTNYYEVVPKHAVELALWLERERMAHFLPVLDASMLEVQRSVVINERKQVYDNRPYGLAHERLQQLMFDTEHPYSWPTIGYTPDLEAITLEDARSFYSRYYAPDNAVVVLAGDIDAETGFSLVDRYFGDLTPSGFEHLPLVAPARQSGERHEVLPDRVSFPRVYHGYTVPAYGTREWIALDALAYVLSDGESSRLQRALIRESEVAQDVDSYLYPTQLDGIFGIVATARSGVSAERLNAEIDSIVRAVLETEVDADELLGAIRRARKDHLSALATIEERADELAYATTILGDPGRLEEILNLYAEVTPEEILSVAQDYLTPERRSVVSVVPKNGGNDVH